MKKASQSSKGGYPEQTEAQVEITEGSLLMDYLIEQGFVWEESLKLLELREHLYENPEMKQRMADDSRLHFARWLFENGEMNEG